MLFRERQETVLQHYLKHFFNTKFRLHGSSLIDPVKCRYSTVYPICLDIIKALQRQGQNINSYSELAEDTHTPQKASYRMSCVRNLETINRVIKVHLYKGYFLSEVNIEMLSMRGQQHSFSTHERMFFMKVSKFLRQKMSRPEGGSNPQPSDLWRMLQSFELSGPDICCLMHLNTVFGGIDSYEVKLTFEM